MATSPEDNQQDQDEFAAAFAGADPVKTEMSEDEAFGLGPVEEEPEMIEAEPGEGDVDMAESGAAGAAGDDAAGAAPSVTIAVEPGAEDNANTEPMDPKDLQRQKSWEGRLKAREAELAAREKALGSHSESAEGETMAEGAAEPAATEALEDAAAKVESGEMTFDQAMATLSNDFGEDFTKMLGVLIEAKAGEIAGKTADERVSKVSQQMDGLVGELVDDKARIHFESIKDAHEDFMDIAASPEFKEYISAMDETQRATAEKTIESGSARSIIKLLSNYKSAGPKAEPVDEASMDAAEGVRSSGLKIPSKPAESEDYEDAWSQF